MARRRRRQQRNQLAVSRTQDAWANTTTGVGGPRDKSANFRFQSGALHVVWDDWRLADLYEEDDTSAHIVDAAPTDAMRKGWRLTLSSHAQDTIGRVNDKCDQLKVNKTVLEARRWARLFGQSAIYIGADDGGKPSQPLFRSNINNVHFLHTFERSELQPHTWQDDPYAAGFGEPLTYRVVQSSPGKARGNPIVHRSRLILFEGVSTTRRKRIERNGSGASVLVRVIRILAQFNGAFAQALAQLADSHQNIYKLKGYSKMLAAPDGEAIIGERIKTIDEVRSALNALIMDADEDNFETRSLGSLTGTADLLDKFMLRIASAADMPMTKLFKQSPAGLNATGESDLTIWNAVVESERTDHCQPAIEEILRCIFAAAQGPTGGRQPDGWSIEWPSLWPVTAKEQAEIDNINAQSDRMYFDMGVLKVSHIAKARFGGEDPGRPALSHGDVKALVDFDSPPTVDPLESLLANPPEPEVETTDEEDFEGSSRSRTR